MNNFVWRGRDRFEAISGWLGLKGKKILDIGCRDFGLEKHTGLHKDNRIWGIDIKEPEDAVPNTVWKKHDANLPLPFDDGFFDAVVSLELIEHLDNQIGLVDEIHRVLRPGGMLIISTPNRNSLEGMLGRMLSRARGKRWIAWDSTHKHLFSCGEFSALLKRRFIVEETRGLYFLCKPLEFALGGISPGTTRMIRQMLDAALSGAPVLKGLGFDMVVRCRK